MFSRRKKNKKQRSESTKPTSQVGTDINVLLRLIEKSDTKNPAVLLAAECLKDLPVTVAVNLGIQLARTQKCLLIDLDLKRDSLATVFDVDSSTIDISLQLAPVSTTVDNLAIWPARFFSLINQMNLKQLLKSTEGKYNHILLYAPYLPALIDRKQIAVHSKQAILFSKNGSMSNSLTELLGNHSCKILNAG